MKKITIFVLLLFVPGFAMGMGVDEFINAAGFGDVDALHRFLDNGGNINVQDAMGRTALMLAAGNQRIEVIEFLLDRGADINSVDRDNYTILHYAMIADDDFKATETALFLHRKINIRPFLFVINHRNENPCAMAVRRNNVQTAGILEDMRNGLMSRVKGIPTENNT